MAKVTFTGIGIQNLGPYRERQFIDLRVRAGRPIVLIKALNGSGKTTLLTCLQVALYGSKALGNTKNTEYEQLIRSLHRDDATGPARIELSLSIEADGEREDLTLSREWVLGSKLVEHLQVERGGTPDLQLCNEWDEFLDGILPAELVQLFLFDGEKIEALANPKTLPDMLRRATEAFLGIGGIDTLSKDLVAVERRVVLDAKKMGNDYEQAKQEYEALERQQAAAVAAVEILAQKQGGAKVKAIKAKEKYAEESAKAQRSGLAAYEKATEIRATEQQAREQVASAAASVREALADPYSPLAGLGDLWSKYKQRWGDEQDTRASRLMLTEIGRRDCRILQDIGEKVSDKARTVFEQALRADSERYQKAAGRKLVLCDAPDPESVELLINAADARYRAAQTDLANAKARLAELERQVAAIPAGEQLADILSELEHHAGNQSRAESELESVQRQLAEQESTCTHLTARTNAARQRMSKDFQGQAMDMKAIAAAQRTRSVLNLFKDRLLASKANWLSDKITEEFRSLMRKKLLISAVKVDPDTYEVSIISGKGKDLPMERLSAGERQLLAIAVLSALIRERKGYFPVVVDTPLARMDRSHREALIRRFFSKVSHQVMVLSTDEEVEGSVFEEMARHTSAAYFIEYSDATRCSSVGPLNVPKAT